VIAALEKAQALTRLAKHTGAKPSEFIVTLTLGEAYELLDHMAATYDSSLLRQDIAEAKAEGDPFRVLAGWQLSGFAIVPVAELN